MAESDALRQHLLDLLRGRNAHADFDAVLADFPSRQRGLKPPGAPHSAWQLLEHMRIAQSDILEFSRDGKHKSPPWPEGYWPKAETPPSAASWNNSLRSFRADLKAMAKLVGDKRTDLFAKNSAWHRPDHSAGGAADRGSQLVSFRPNYFIAAFVGELESVNR